MSDLSPPLWDDARLFAALGDLRERLVVPDEPLRVDEPLTRRGRDDRRWGRRALLVAAAAVLILVVLGASIPPARHAVADWLGLGSTQVRVGAPEPEIVAELPAIDAGARVVDANAAAQELERSLPPLTHPATNAPPVFAIPTEGGVIVRWAGRTESLWMRDVGGDAQAYFSKLVYLSEDVERVDGLGDAALWIGAAHVLETPGRSLAAAHVLLWSEDGLELRLEGDQSRDEMVALAHTLVPS